MHGKGEGAGFKTGLIDFTAGSLGGVALVYVSQPMDTVKVKMQTFPHLYRNMIDCTVRTFQRDGVVRGLYAGTLPAIVANVAENSVLFAAYGACQNFVAFVERKQSVAELTSLDNATAGFLAAFFSSFTLCPTELIKCKLQAMREVQQNNLKPNEKLQRISPYQLTKQILRTEGIPGMFRGLTSTFAREMPGYFFFFGGYEATRELLAKPGQSKDDIGVFRTMVAGAVGGVALWTSIFPADVIKSRIQVQSLTLSMTQVGIDIVRKEGALALYNGLQPTIVRTIPATAVLFVVYEYTKRFMSNLFL
ncbi:mitochondrial ornithine transporter 1 [Topomyia yanbarensis]|uniref:mitochondrial ornithine transporter 1 n=1 Tax=Topomyia yanbarensis TaxID=2498891 RepID=UPI00273B4DA9|nr:mitochondrial ornithine transporter 1 [Topomyia yanbarensis]XP_058818326.1 mitochondrial ornithine transporter 1 [Topomyia yanbarensis]